MTDNPKNTSQNHSAIDQLLAVMNALRDPKTGCPWDLEQTFETIVPYTIEEAYEVAEAINDGDMDSLKSELGDLLFQTVFLGQIAKENGKFDFHDIAETMTQKLIRRHPHVFPDGDAVEVRDADGQSQAWETQKANERAAKGLKSVLDDVPRALPALMRAQKLQKRAASVGFDWSHAGDVLAKMKEELGEFSAEIEHGDQDKAAKEFGDLLFVLVNLGRHLKIDAEEALRQTNHKFERRFQWMEKEASAKATSLESLSLDDQEELWQAAKAVERAEK